MYINVTFKMISSSNVYLMYRENLRTDYTIHKVETIGRNFEILRSTLAEDEEMLYVVTVGEEGPGESRQDENSYTQKVEFEHSITLV